MVYTKLLSDYFLREGRRITFCMSYKIIRASQIVGIEGRNEKYKVFLPCDLFLQISILRK